MNKTLALIIGLQIASFLYLNSKLEAIHATAEAALNAAREARMIAFEAKRIAETNSDSEIPPDSSCNPETGSCHTPRYFPQPMSK